MKKFADRFRPLVPISGRLPESSLLNSPRLHALLAVLILGIVAISFAIDTRCENLTCRGDFPAFYAAANLSTSPELYHPLTQRYQQQLAWPSLQGQYLYFAYPPYTAALYAPLALVAAPAAKVLLLIFSVLALIAAVRCLPIARSQASLFLLFLLCPQVIIAIAAGQNTSVSMLLAIVMLVSPSARNRGLAAGIWWFKPQFALFALLGLLITRDKKAVFWSLIPAAVYFLIACLQLGWSWPVEWLAAVSEYHAKESQINGLQSFSPFSVLQIWTITSVALFSTVALTAHLLWQSVRFKPRKPHFEESTSRQVILAIWLIAGLLLSPRTMFYDFGIVVAILVATLPLQVPLLVVVIGGACLGALFGPPYEALILCCLALLIYGKLSHASLVLRADDSRTFDQI